MPSSTSQPDGFGKLLYAARASAAAAGALALLALLGWATGAEQLVSFGIDRAATSVATAACFLLAVLALSVALGARRLTRAAMAAPLAILAASGYALLRYIFGVEAAGYLLGSDWGSMSFATALALLLLASALLSIQLGRSAIAAFLGGIGLILCEIALLGYFFDVAALHRVAPFADMSLPTTIATTLLFAATLLARPRENWMRYFVQRGPAGSAFRLLLPAMLLAPPFWAGVVLLAIRTGQMPVPFGLALLAVAMTVMQALLTSLTADWLDRQDAASRQLAAIVASSDDAIIAKALDGTLLSWNQGAERLFGHDAREAIGKPVSIILPPECVEEESALLAAIGRGEKVQSFETTRRHCSGREIPVSVTLSPIHAADGSIVAASSIIRDMTELHRRDQELRRSNAELEQFAYVASHDLQEPLRMVANYTELLADRYRGQLDERADKYIHYASDGARRMQRLVADLLSYSRVGSQGRPLERVDSAQVVSQVLTALSPLIAETGATVEHAGLPWVMADASQLAQLFQNLIRNAIKFRGDQPARVSITATPENDRWHFTVTDNGIGIDMRFAERIFQMFQRLHERGAYDGSGIGLAIVKRIVERHGGRIWVESIPGQGSSFHFTLSSATEQNSA